MNSETSYLEGLSTLQTFCANPQHIETTNNVITGMVEAYQQGAKVLACGNGGSTCDAMHFCEELTGQYRDYRKALPAIALCDPAHITCVANDFGFNKIFSRGVEAYGQAGDWLIALSTSGNSENMIEAVTVANQIKMKTFALLGKEGGKLKGVCDHEIIVEANTSDRIQEIHMMVLHIIIEGIERGLFPENYN